MSSLIYLTRSRSIILVVLLLLTACGNDLWGNYSPDQTPGPGNSGTETLSPYAVTATALASASPPTSTPTLTLTRTTSAEITSTPKPALLYASQSGDSLEVVAVHFGVLPGEITSSVSLPQTGFITPGTMLFIPNRLSDVPTTPSVKLLPDSEIIYGPGAADFDTAQFVDDAGGYLAGFREYLADPGWITGAGSIQRLAFESSINPRFLLAYLQYSSDWVKGTPPAGVDVKYPLGYHNPFYEGLYQEMRLLVQELDAGYYGWRAGTLTELTFPDGTTLRIAPDLNAGTVALQYLFSRHLDYSDWLQVVDSGGSFLSDYVSLFGDPWARAALVEPLFPPGFIQPAFSLPFEVGVPWTFTGGPHPAWEQESALAALDFAPPSTTSGCVESTAWVVAMAPGLIVRSGGGYVVIDLDGDGFEQTGWDVLHLHIASNARVPAGTWVDAGDRIGHPSCEGGIAYGTHLHIARKYNGEWVGAGGPLPFVLSGWTTHEAERAKYGTMTKGDRVITSSPVSSHESLVIRQPGD